MLKVITLKQFLLFAIVLMSDLLVLTVLHFLKILNAFWIQKHGQLVKKCFHLIITSQNCRKVLSLSRIIIKNNCNMQEVLSQWSISKCHVVTNNY